MDSYFYDQINPKINHLNKEQIDELIRRYYANEKVVNLIKDFNIDTKSNNITSIFPIKVYKDLKCEYCGSYMSVSFLNKTARVQETEPVCISCGHNNTDSCNCNGCIQKREDEMLKEKEYKKAVIFNTYSNGFEKNLVNKQELSYLDMLYLGSVLRAGTDESLEVIKGRLLKKNELAPKSGFSRKILKYLKEERKLIRISEQSPYDAFIDDEDFPYKYKVYEVYYDLLIDFKDDIERNDFVRKLILGDYNKKDMFENSLELWKLIALEECKEYLIYKIESIGWEFNPGNKTDVIFNKLLENYSTSQVCGIINSAIKDALLYYNSTSVTKKQASNSVVSRCLKIGEFALAQGWSRYKCSRADDCNQSVISMYLFDNIFYIGDKGYFSVPTKVSDISKEDSDE